MEQSRVDRILEAIDAGLQATSEPSYGENGFGTIGYENQPDRDLKCIRCMAVLEAGDFCDGCRAFMLGDADTDPRPLYRFWEFLLGEPVVDDWPVVQAPRGAIRYFQPAVLAPDQEPIEYERRSDGTYEMRPAQVVEVERDEAGRRLVAIGMSRWSPGDLIAALDTCGCMACRIRRGEQLGIIDSGPLDLGITRDPVSDRTNDLTMFYEEFITVSRSGLDAVVREAGFAGPPPDQIEVRWQDDTLPASIAASTDTLEAARQMADRLLARWARAREDRLLQAIRSPDADD